MIAHGSDEWHANRLGIPTGSDMWKIMPDSAPVDPGANEEKTPRKRAAASTPFGRSVTWGKYASEKLAERITGAKTRRFVNRAMRHGSETEPAAITAYEVETGNIVITPGFISMGRWGCTPDGLVDDDGIISIKCPDTETFVYQLACDHRIQPENYWQVMAEMAATGRKWADLVFYDPDIPSEEGRLFVRRIHRDEAAIQRMLHEIATFCDFLDDKCSQLGVSWPPQSNGRRDPSRILLAG